MKIRHIVVFLEILALYASTLYACDLPKTPEFILTNELVSVRIIPAWMDTSIPQYKEEYQPYVSLLRADGSTNNLVQVDFKIIINNDSKWPYVFGTPYSLTGYDCLELDVGLDDGKVIRIKRRQPKYLSSKGECDNITVKPNSKWEQLISFDRRLWDFPTGAGAFRVCKIRPRFAFGAYKIDGKYYRTLSEVQSGKRKQRAFGDRDGELVGEWVDHRNKPSRLLGGGVWEGDTHVKCK